MQADDWYRNSSGKIVFDKKIESQEDLDRAGIEGEYIADTFIGIDQNNSVFRFNENGTVSKASQSDINEEVQVEAIQTSHTVVNTKNERKDIKTDLMVAFAVSQSDSPVPGPADVIAVGLMIQAVHNWLTNPTVTSEVTLSFAKDSGKNGKHGDGGRALTKAEKQIEALEAQLANAVGNEAKKIKQKIQNVRRTAEKKKEGEEHSKANKR
jgi:hypothetical protein